MTQHLKTTLDAFTELAYVAPLAYRRGAGAAQTIRLSWRIWFVSHLRGVRSAWDQQQTPFPTLPLKEKGVK
jgi:hypothetical protein